MTIRAIILKNVLFIFRLVLDHFEIFADVLFADILNCNSFIFRFLEPIPSGIKYSKYKSDDRTNKNLQPIYIVHIHRVVPMHHSSGPITSAKKQKTHNDNQYCNNVDQCLIWYLSHNSFIYYFRFLFLPFDKLTRIRKNSLAHTIFRIWWKESKHPGHFFMLFH